MGFFDFFYNNDALKNLNKSSENTRENASRFQPFNEEFSMDMTTEPYGTNIKELDNSYSSSGVEIHDTRNTLRVLYSGILAKNGAKEIYAVIGYGDNLNWENVQEYPMHKLSNKKYELIFPVNRAGEINMAFKDSANNWDNNSGRNFTFTNYVYEGSH
ncbi:carbohydrate-binding protein [Acetivibrio cellulolyticus]|uniref:carbohydrate-binding protein n=1 Tax=Acetivibrio cellulolyticus TaxID=35830 RepID=UPI0001E30546|nr:carbohydrate-binding protein [Acetivibrio cellulolyticus]